MTKATGKAAAFSQLAVCFLVGVEAAIDGILAGRCLRGFARARMVGCGSYMSDSGMKGRLSGRTCTLASPHFRAFCKALSPGTPL